MSIPKECLDRHRILAFHHTEESDQAFFETNSNFAIDHCVEKIFKKNLEEKSLNSAKASSCFDKTITFTSSFRNKIALVMEEKFATFLKKPFDPDSCPFGVSRLAAIPTITEVGLCRSYETTGNKVAQIISRDLQDARELNTFTGHASAKSCEAAAKTTSSSILFDDENHLHLEMNWKVFKKDEIDDSVKDCTQVDEETGRKNPTLMAAIQLNAMAKGSGLESQAKALIARSLFEIVNDRKKSNPALFWYKRDMSILTNIQKVLPNFELLRPSAISTKLNPTGYIIGTLSYSIQGRAPVVLTKYSTYFESRPEESEETILDRIQKNSIILLTHQDITDVTTTLSDAKLYFDKAIDWTPDQDIEILKDTVGKMVFLLAHNHRDIRGTAAATQWIEKAIYQLHGFKMEHEKERMPDLIAFGNYHMKEYLEEYKGSFSLVPA